MSWRKSGGRLGTLGQNALDEGTIPAEKKRSKEFFLSNRKGEYSRSTIAAQAGVIQGNIARSQADG